ncbi:MAG: MinD/ParA family protein [Nitrospirae bacterium]|nr:MinD/ParA family protein [Nitrospirota bacterium]
MNIAEGKTIRTIAVASGKGGVGKTNITANLAIGLSKLDKKVLVFDADLGLSNIDVILNLITKYNIKHLFKGEKKLRDLIVEGPMGIKVLPASSGIQELTALDEFQRLRLIEEFESYGDDMDYLLIDTSAGISANVAFFCMAAQEIIIVTSAEPTAMTDAYALIKVLFTKYQEKKFKVLVNSAKNAKEATDVYRRLSTAAERFLSISLDYLGYVPYDNSVQKAVRQQKAFIEIYPDSEAAKSIMHLAEKISNENNSNVKGTLQFFLGGLLKARC